MVSRQTDTYFLIVMPGLTRHPENSHLDAGLHSRIPSGFFEYFLNPSGSGRAGMTAR
jgi:hypothetical protein